MIKKEALLTAQGFLFAMQKHSKIGHVPLLAARPLNHGAWAGTAHMRENFMRPGFCLVSWCALGA